MNPLAIAAIILVIVLIFNVLSTASYLFAGRTLKADLARAHELS